MQDSVGKPLTRVDGRAKVTGRAVYAAEQKAPNSAHAVLVTSAIAKGTIASLDTAAAQLTSAGDLFDAREKFARLSDALITYMDGLHLTPPEGVHIAQCETTRKQWLQEGDSIANPYDGSSVPGCGTLR